MGIRQKKKGYIYAHTLVHHQERIALDLSILEYCVVDLIFQISNNPNSKYPGWCYASKGYMAECLDITRKTIHVILTKLMASQLVEKQESTGYLRAMPVWYDAIVTCNKKLQPRKIEPVTKGYTESNEKLQPPEQKVTSLNDMPMDTSKEDGAEASALTGPLPIKPQQPQPRPRTPAQQRLDDVVLGFKIAQGIPEEDKEWDKTDYKKTAPYAKEMLIYFNDDVVRCLNCIEDIAKYFIKEKLTWSPTAICRHKADWQAQKTGSGKYLGIGRAVEVVQKGSENNG